MRTSVVRDVGLAPEGRLKIDWVHSHMPVLGQIEREYASARPLQGKRVVVCCHLEAKTARLALALASLGAEVSVAGSNPLSTQDDVAAALATAAGVRVYAWHGATPREYEEFLEMAMGDGADVIMDDGGDVIGMLHMSLRGLLPGVIGGCEETTTGVARLRALERSGELAFPVIAVNDAKMKQLFDNRYGTGQSAWDGIMRTTNLTVAGRCVVVSGYGWVGKGLAMRGRGLGARVIVTEVDPVAACEAVMDGFEVMPMADAARRGDFFITATGCNDVIRREHMQVMRDGVVLANAGHFNVEISLSDLEGLCDGPAREVRRGVQEYTRPDGHRLYVLAQGRLVNLAAGDGHPAEVMDMSFALQALCIMHLAAKGRDMAPRVCAVPEEADRRVAQLALAASGASIDALSAAQRNYLASWTSGTV